MKPIKILLMAVITILSVSVYAQEPANSKSSSKEQTEKLKYSCPMHPEITSDKPGKCPKCGMVLKASGKTTRTYVCPMHPDITSNKPGNCSKCGMVLTLSPKEKMKYEVMKLYTCPMHPDVRSDKPGKCSKCGMDLIKSKRD